jgi:hypothetical protein
MRELLSLIRIFSRQGLFAFFSVEGCTKTDPYDSDTLFEENVGVHIDPSSSGEIGDAFAFDVSAV